MLVQFKPNRTEPEPTFEKLIQTEPNPNRVLEKKKTNRTEPKPAFRKKAEPNRTELDPEKVGSIRALVSITIMLYNLEILPQMQDPPGYILV
jgi:hypothetical protein